MARLPVKPTTLRALLAKSGNLCAFSGCTHELVNHKNIFVAEVCHIEAVERGGERHSDSQTDEQRRSYDNLILLCHKHHVETDDVGEYPVDRLQEMKAKHETVHGKKPFKVDESVIFRIEAEMLKYWKEVEQINEFEHVAKEFSVPVKAPTSPVEQFQTLYKAVSDIETYTNMLREWDYALNDEIKTFLVKIGYDPMAYDAIPYYKNPFANRAWEIHNLGIPNRFTDLGVSILQVEIRFLEEYLKTHAQDAVAMLRFEKAKAELKEIARAAGYAD